MTAVPFRYFAIFGAMRTGSNLLERSLNQFDGLRCHGELFNPFFIGKSGNEVLLGVTLEEREVDPTALISALLKQDDGRVHGFRIFQGHDQRIVDAALADPDCAKVILRRNPLESYVSLKIARKTDQWLLGNVKKRKTARIRFEADEYSEYLEKLNNFHAELNRKLQKVGQTAFLIDFEDLKSLPVINGLGRFLGAAAPLKSIEEPIKRQNPEPLKEKVENYDDMLEALQNLAQPAQDVEDRDAGNAGQLLRSMVAKPDKPLIFSPLPGVNNTHVLSWIGERSIQFANRKDLNDYLDKCVETVSFTLLAHPVERAYDVFWRRILANGPGSFPKIRRRLSRHHGVILPEEGGQLSAEACATSFEAFCSFLKSNVAGQTGLRIDNDWAPQDWLVERLTTVLPPRHVLRPDEIAEFCNRVDPSRAIGAAIASNPIPLSQVYSKRIENLVRATYARDYRKFGFGPWSGSL